MAHELDSDPDKNRATANRSAAGGDPQRDSWRKKTEQILGRRGYLRWTAAAAAAAALGSGGASAGTTRHGITFARVVDAVEDLEADPTGTEPVNQQLTEIPTNSLVRFPEGDYLIDGRVSVSGHTQLGFESAGNATFIGTKKNSGLDISAVEIMYYSGFVHADTGGSINHRVDGSELTRIRDVRYGETTMAPVSEADHASVVEVDATGTAATYEITVSGEITPVDDSQTPSDLSVFGGCAEGTVGSGTHALSYTGAITAIKVIGDATVRLNGEPISVDGESETVDPRLTNVASIKPCGNSASTQYTFTSLGDLSVDSDRASPSYSGWSELAGDADERTVTGDVESGVNAYQFSGGIDTLDITGPACVSVESSCD